MIRFIPLWIALLFANPVWLDAQRVVATREDTAFARAVLSDALQAYSRIKGTAPPHTEERLLAQLTLWGMDDQAWSFTLARDSARTGEQRGGWLIGRGLAAQLDKGDTTGVVSRVAALPTDIRGPVVEALMSMARCFHRGIVDQLVAQLEDRFERAQALAAGGDPCGPNTEEAARASLRAAIDLADDTLTGQRASRWKHWHYRLRRLGGDVSVQKLVEITRREHGDLRAAQFEVARMLVSQLDYVAAAPLLDTLQVHYSQLTPRPYTMLALIHDMRRTGPDSAIARAMRDTAQQEQITPPAWQVWNARDKLRQVLDSLNQTATRIALDTAISIADPVGIIVLTAQHIQQRITYPYPRPDSIAARGSAIEFARFLRDELWRVSAKLPGVARDSARVAVVALLASFDEQRALTLAQREFRVPRLRDRAIAEVARRIAATDADAAAALAAPLRDPIARNTVYRALADYAVAGGRLQLAKRFADRTASGEARVLAQFAVANALFDADSTAQARARATALLEHLDPVWRCDGCAIVMEPNTVLPPEPTGMGRYLIGQVVLLVLKTGGAAELRAWTDRQQTAEARVSAGLALAEGWAQLRLGRFPDYPIH